MKKILLVLIALGFLLAGCSVSDMNDTGMVNVSLGGDGRYIVSDGTTVDNAYLGLIDEDVLYNFEELENVKAGSDGTIRHTFSAIPVGDYTFIALLMDEEDHNLAMALDPTTIEEGVNNLVVEMGPGFTLEIGGLDFELDDMDEAFTLDFSGDTIIIELSISDIEDAFTQGISSLEVEVMDTNAQNIEILNWAGTASYGSFSYTAPASEDEWSNNNTLTISPAQMILEDYKLQFMLRMHSWDTTGVHPDEKGYKDYKIQLELKF